MLDVSERDILLHSNWMSMIDYFGGEGIRVLGRIPVLSDLSLNDVESVEKFFGHIFFVKMFPF